MIPDGLASLIRKHEGLSLKPYKCPAGKQTIGIGHNYDANPLPDVIAHHLETFGSITPEMADQLLEEDIVNASFDCHQLYRDFDKFSEQRRWALIDFCFNVGIRTARSFSNTNRAINRGD
jgi:lysozyme